jgi:hypothetical protein
MSRDRFGELNNNNYSRSEVSSSSRQGTRMGSRQPSRNDNYEMQPAYTRNQSQATMGNENDFYNEVYKSDADAGNFTGHFEH